MKNILFGKINIDAVFKYTLTIIFNLMFVNTIFTNNDFY